MARRPDRSARPARSGPTGTGTGTAVTGASPCPCGLSAAYGACCGRYHSGTAAAPTAELLMRSRYSAFAVRDQPYLLKSWDPATRPPAVDLDPTVRWTGLEILDMTDGSAFHTTGTVTFRARFTHRGARGSLHERSRFARHEGAWVYVDGTFVE
ncbi:YchJ family protein [Streptomyces sp. NBC_00872]|uniref:YchJ family protein n=1 Tax=Streptomyces sp. NBC_00872 TaxID=2903686 RepID=UPI00386F3656|nr:YchJ family protein [Streptomyces sp. NBC_00872]